MSRRSRSIEFARRDPAPNSIYLVKEGSRITRGCLHPVRGLPALIDNSIDHTITDPPFETHTHEKRRRIKKKRVIHRDMGFDAMDSEQRVIVASEIVRVTRGWALIFCEDTAIKLWQDALIDSGAKRWVTCIWTKPNASANFTGMGPAQPCEHFVCVWCGGGKQTWNGGGKVGRYHYAIDKYNRKHHTEKPLELMEQIILDFTMPGQLVCDPYMGSGHTLVAAKKLGRKYIGWEIDPKPYKVADDRLRVTREQTMMEQMLTHRVARKTAFGLDKVKRVRQRELIK